MLCTFANAPETASDSGGGGGANGAGGGAGTPGGDGGMGGGTGGSGAPNRRVKKSSGVLPSFGPIPINWLLEPT